MWLTHRAFKHIREARFYARRERVTAREVIGTRPGESRPHERACISAAKCEGIHTDTAREHYAITHAAVTIMVTAEKDFYASASLSVPPFNEIRIGPVSFAAVTSIRVGVRYPTRLLSLIARHPAFRSYLRQRNGTRSMHTIHMEICWYVPRVSR